MSECQHVFLKLLGVPLQACVHCGAVKVGDSVIIDSDYITMASLESDPDASAGRLWYRSDLKELRVFEGVEAKTVTTT